MAKVGENGALTAWPSLRSRASWPEMEAKTALPRTNAPGPASSSAADPSLSPATRTAMGWDPTAAMRSSTLPLPAHCTVLLPCVPYSSAALTYLCASHSTAALCAPHLHTHSAGFLLGGHANGRGLGPRMSVTLLLPPACPLSARVTRQFHLYAHPASQTQFSKAQKVSLLPCAPAGSTLPLCSAPRRRLFPKLQVQARTRLGTRELVGDQGTPRRRGMRRACPGGDTQPVRARTGSHRGEANRQICICCRSTFVQKLSVRSEVSVPTDVSRCTLTH